MRTARHASKDGSPLPKAERCLLAGCPLSGTNDPRCAACTGPVVWTDADGIEHGCARACSSCPMDKLGLPVCWAACPGPNDDFSTDGQKMVTLGGMEDPDGFVAAMGDAGKMVADGFCFDDSDANDGGEGRDQMLFILASRALLLSGNAWDAFRNACAEKNARNASKAAGAPLGAFRGPNGRWDGSAAERLMGRLGALDAKNWEAVRRLALGDAQKRVADLTLVRKQAMNQRIKRLSRDCGWVLKLAEK